MQSAKAASKQSVSVPMHTVPRREEAEKMRLGSKRTAERSLHIKVDACAMLISSGTVYHSIITHGSYRRHV